MCSAAVSYFKNIFNDSFQTIYLKIYWTDSYQICRVGRTLAVDDQYEISFSIYPSGDMMVATNLCWFYPQIWALFHRTEFQ